MHSTCRTGHYPEKKARDSQFLGLFNLGSTGNPIYSSRTCRFFVCHTHTHTHAAYESGARTCYEDRRAAMCINGGVHACITVASPIRYLTSHSADRMMNSPNRPYLAGLISRKTYYDRHAVLPSTRWYITDSFGPPAIWANLYARACMCMHKVVEKL